MQVTDSLRRTIKEQDDIRRWLFEGVLPPLVFQSPSIAYSLNEQVGEISIGELLHLIDSRVESAFAERLPAPMPSQGVLEAVDHIVGKKDPAALVKFLRRFPQEQRSVIEDYIAAATS